MGGTAKGPSVWVFDARDPEQGVMNTAISRIDQVAGIIAQIRDRLNQPIQASALNTQAPVK